MEMENNSQSQVPLQNPQNQPVQNSFIKTKRKPFIILAVIVLLLIIGGVGSFYLGAKNNGSSLVQKSISTVQPTPNPTSIIPSTAYIRLSGNNIESVDLSTNNVRIISSIGPDLVDTSTSSADYKNGTYGNYTGQVWSGIKLVPLKNIGKILAYYSKNVDDIGAYHADGTQVKDDYRVLSIVMYDYVTGKGDILYQTRQFPFLNGLRPKNYDVFYNQDSNQIFVLSSFTQTDYPTINQNIISGFAVYRLNSQTKSLDPYGSNFNTLPQSIKANLSFAGKNNNNQLIINDPQSDYLTYFQSSITDTFDKAISKIKTQKAYLVDMSNPSVQEATITSKDLSLIDKKYEMLYISESTSCGELSIRTSGLPFNTEINNIEKPTGDYFYQPVGYSTKLKYFVYKLENMAKDELNAVRQAKSKQELDNACGKYFNAQTNDKYMIYSTQDKSSQIISRDILVKQYLQDIDIQMDVNSLISSPK